MTATRSLETSQGQKPARQRAERRRPGQARRGPLAWLLSFLGGTLTILTAIAVVLLIVAPGSQAPALHRLVPAVDAQGTPLGPDAEAGPAHGLARLGHLLASPDWTWARRLALRLAPDGFTFADLSFDLGETAAGEAIVVSVRQLHIQPDERGVRTRIDGALQDRPGTDFAVTAELLADAAAADAATRFALRARALDPAVLVSGAGLDTVEIEGGPVAIDVGADLGPRGLNGPVRFMASTSEPLLLRAATMPEALPTDQFQGAFAWHPDTDSVDIEWLSLRSPALHMKGQGRVSEDGLGATIAIDAFDVTWAERLWPQDIARGARNWLTQNITAGTIEAVDVTIDLDAATLAGGPLPATAIRGRGRVSGGEIHYLRPMPPVTEASADAVFDADRLTFTITGGQLQAVEVTGGEVVVSDYGDAATTERLAVDVTGRGAVPEILAITDHEPLMLATRYDLPRDTSTGSGDFRVQVGLPLLADVSFDEVDFGFTGDFTDVGLPGGAAGRDLTDADFRFDATSERIQSDGNGRIAGVPLDFTYLLDAPADIERLTGSGRVDIAALTALGLPEGLPAAGTTAFEATLDLAGAVERQDLRLDLTDTEISLPALALWKPRGIEGTLEATLVDGADGLALDPVILRWPGADVAVRGRLDTAGQIETLVVDPFQIAGTDLRITVERSGAAFAAHITGPRLDLGPLLNEGAGPGGTRDGGATGPETPLLVDWSIDEVSAGERATLRAVRGDAAVTTSGRVDRLALNAATSSTADALDVRIRPAGQHHDVDIESSDAGLVLLALGLNDSIFGGRLSVDATMRSQSPRLEIEGELSARDFILRGAPGVVRLLAATPAEMGLGENELRVDQASTPFHLEGSTLRLDDATVQASNLAMRLFGTVDLETGNLDIQGSLAPLAAINRFIGDIPLLGQLLQGSRQAGAFALSFTVRGPRTDPAVTVNPLSVVTPGVLQDLFSGIEINPPRVPDD